MNTETSEKLLALQWLNVICHAILYIAIAGLSFSDRPYAGAEVFGLAVVGGLALGLLGRLTKRMERTEASPSAPEQYLVAEDEIAKTLQD